MGSRNSGQRCVVISKKNHEIDLVRWHMGIIKEQASNADILSMDSGTLIARGLAQYVEDV